ncbi:MAG: response regulator [Chloroflexota bacterium]|nr:response regulator [Chloroflexota bacterium]
MAKILHLDDDPRQTELLRLMLRNEPYVLLSAQESATALVMARAEKPDVILVDINMPRMNGVEFAAEIKRIPELAQIPLIAMTANTMYGDREYYLSHNFSVYLAKPVLRFELVRALKSLLTTEPN